MEVEEGISEEEETAAEATAAATENSVAGTTAAAGTTFESGIYSMRPFIQVTKYVGSLGIVYGSLGYLLMIIVSLVSQAPQRAMRHRSCGRRATR